MKADLFYARVFLVAALAVLVGSVYRYATDDYSLVALLFYAGLSGALFWAASLAWGMWKINKKIAEI